MKNTLFSLLLLLLAITATAQITVTPAGPGLVQEMEIQERALRISKPEQFRIMLEPAPLELEPYGRLAVLWADWTHDLLPQAWLNFSDIPYPEGHEKPVFSPRVPAPLGGGTEGNR